MTFVTSETRVARVMRHLTWLALAACAQPATAHPTVEPSVALRFALPSTEVQSLHSAANGIDYELYVSLPPGYDSSTAHYPVVFLLDADYSFPIAHAATRHLTERQHLPPVILVAIAYGGELHYRLNRTRDYTPTFVATGGYGPEYQRVSGGAPRFLDFMEKELVPYVDAHYRTRGDRTLVGHSYGGLFALWASLTRPTLFQRVLAVSPSIWYDDHLLMKLEAAQRSAGAPLPARMYLTVGGEEINEQVDMVTDLRSFAARLQARHDAHLAVQSEVVDGETHNSIFPGAVTRGLRWLFDDMGAR
jgi:predicted alpha/beta superfamily hydrolase